MDDFLEIYGKLPRAGPGDDASTRRALAMMADLPPRPRILDIGSGPGAQTVELLKRSDGTVVALDLLPQMIKRTEEAVRGIGESDRCELVQADMREMTFEPGSFDVVWSEGALYFLGFRDGLARVRELVRPGGYIAVSDAVWLRPDPPSDLVDFWRQYPEIDTVEHKLQVIRDVGLDLIGHFTLPGSAWTEPYYAPMARLLPDLERRWQGRPEALAILEAARVEIAMFEQYSDYYSYAFFVMRR